MKYIIGVDGGATKTLGILFSKDGTERKRSKKGFSNFSVNEEQSKGNIISVLDELTAGINSDDILLIEIGVAGYSNYLEKDEFELELARKYNTKVSFGTDAAIAYYSVKKDYKKKVIMVLGGTGSVITFEHQDEIQFVGGFGHILGDEGSGYHLAIAALKMVIKQFEEAKIVSKLSKSILKELNITDYNDIKNFVYNNQKSDIAKLSEFIGKKADEADKEAIKLFIDEGVHLAEQTMIAYKTIGHTEEIIIGLKGGFLLEGPYVKEAFIQEIKKYGIKFKIDDQPTEPAYGAYYLALKHLSSKEVA